MRCVGVDVGGFSGPWSRLGIGVLTGGGGKVDEWMIEELR